MLLTITTTYQPATDIGFLLAKNPARVQRFELTFGAAHVFYPEASAERCTAALLLDVDPVALVRGRGAGQGLLDHYVNDRPYVASSLLSVAIAEVLGSALNGRSRERPELALTPLPLEARLAALPARGGEALLRKLFEPLGYQVDVATTPLDERFPEWGISHYVTLSLRGTVTLSDLLSHLYVLIPVLDTNKHYYIGQDEIDKLMRHGEGWLASHPERSLITRRYLPRKHLAREALARLVAADSSTDDTESEPAESEPAAEAAAPAERRLSLHEQRLGAVAALLKQSGAASVLDLGCGEGRLIQLLVAHSQFTRILGMDIAHRTLEQLSERLERLAPLVRRRIELIHGSLTYRDSRLAGFDAAAVVEVIEHMDVARLAAFERVLFEFARPGMVVVTTPNAEYNVRFETLPAGNFRHSDHRFEWTRAQFQTWAERVATQHGYQLRLLPLGPEDADVGAPSQAAVFSLEK